MRVLFCTMLVIPLGATLAAAEERATASAWPGFRGRGDSHAAVDNLPLTWELRGRTQGSWSVRLPGYGQSSPVVWGQKVFVTAVSGEQKEHLHVLALNLADGTRLWQRDFLGTQRVPDGDTVSRGAPTPCVDPQHLYAVFESGDVFALTHEGELVWERSLVRDYGEFRGPHGYASSPVLAEDRLVIQVCHSGPSYVLALDKKTGQNLWKVEHPSQTGWSTPALFEHQGVKGVIVSSSGSVRAYDLADGHPLWWLTGIQGNSTATPTVWKDLVVIGGSSEQQRGLPAPGTTAGSLAIRLGGSGDVRETHLLWQSSKISAGYASPLVADGLAYFVGRIGTLQCVDVQTGEVKWQHRLPGTAWASPVYVKGAVLFFCKDGPVVALQAGSELQEIGESTISATDVVYGVAAVDSAWLVRTGRSLLKITAASLTE